MGLVYQHIKLSALATILQVAFFSCTGMLTVMTSSLHNTKLVNACSLSRSKLVERTHCTFFLFIASQNGGAYTKVYGSVQKLPTYNVTIRKERLGNFFHQQMRLIERFHHMMTIPYNRNKLPSWCTTCTVCYQWYMRYRLKNPQVNIYIVVLTDVAMVFCLIHHILEAL